MASEAWADGRRQADATVAKMPKPDVRKLVRPELKATAVKLDKRSLEAILAELDKLVEEGERARAKVRQRRLKPTTAERALTKQAATMADRKVAKLAQQLERGEAELTGRALGQLRRDIVDALADIDWATSQRAERERYADDPRVGGIMPVPRQDGRTTPECQFTGGLVVAADDPDYDGHPSHIHCRTGDVPIPITSTREITWYRTVTRTIGEPRADSPRKRRYRTAAANIQFAGPGAPPWKTLAQAIVPGKRRDARVRQPRSKRERERQWLEQEARRNKALLEKLREVGVLESRQAPAPPPPPKPRPKPKPKPEPQPAVRPKPRPKPAAPPKPTPKPPEPPKVQPLTVGREWTSTADLMREAKRRGMTQGEAHDWIRQLAASGHIEVNDTGAQSNIPESAVVTRDPRGGGRVVDRVRRASGVQELPAPTPVRPPDGIDDVVLDVVSRTGGYSLPIRDVVSAGQARGFTLGQVQDAIRRLLTRGDVRGNSYGSGLGRLTDPDATIVVAGEIVTNIQRL